MWGALFKFVRPVFAPEVKSRQCCTSGALWVALPGGGHPLPAGSEQQRGADAHNRAAAERSGGGRTLWRARIDQTGLRVREMAEMGGRGGWDASRKAEFAPRRRRHTWHGVEIWRIGTHFAHRSNLDPESVHVDNTDQHRS